MLKILMILIGIAVACCLWIVVTCYLAISGESQLHLCRCGLVQLGLYVVEQRLCGDLLVFASSKRSLGVGDELRLAFCCRRDALAISEGLTTLGWYPVGNDDNLIGIV